MSTANIAIRSVMLTQSTPVELWDLDLAPLSGPMFRFAGQVNEKQEPIVWQGNTYNPLPISATGFERRVTGPFPRPRVQVSNVLGVIGELIRQYDQLRGARLLRRRTLALFLDAVNFSAGNPNADPLAEYQPEVWMVDQCTARNRLVVQWELRNPLDIETVMLPGRQVQPNYCPWQYRSSDCGYTGGAVAKVDDSPTSSMALDRCSKRLSGCKLRFGSAPLPFGGFPGVGQLRSLS